MQLFTLTFITGALAAVPSAFVQPIAHQMNDHGASSPLTVRDIVAAGIDVLEACDMIRPSDNLLNWRGVDPKPE